MEAIDVCQQCDNRRLVEMGRYHSYESTGSDVEWEEPCPSCSRCDECDGVVGEPTDEHARYIEAFNAGNGVRFNGVWENSTFRAKDLALIERKVKSYMRANNIPGMSIAISRNKKLVFASGYGLADKERGQPVGPAHRFRIASVSKPITAQCLKRAIVRTLRSTAS